MLMALSNLHIGEHTVLDLARSWVLGMTLIGALGARTVPAASIPIGVADNYSVCEDQALDLASPGVLVNDTDPDGNPLTTMLVTEPDHGMVSFNSDGSFYYTPNWNFHGTDSFIYQAQDETTNSSPVAVTLTVLSVNDAPVARADNYSISEDTALMIAAPGVLGNDFDMDGDTVRAVRVGLPGHGTLTFKADGSFTYRPDANFHGTDSFTYTAHDATTNSRPATVTLTVNSVNDRPTAQLLEWTGLQNTPLSRTWPACSRPQRTKTMTRCSSLLTLPPARKAARWNWSIPV